MTIGLLSRVWTGLLVLDSLAAAILLVSGVGLLFSYSPVPESGAAPMRLLHRGAATALVTMAVPSLFVGLAVARSNRIRSRRFLLVAVVIAIAVTPVLGVFTGRLLPWDQLALWARHRGDLNSGFLPFIASSGDIQFVVVGGVEVAVEWVRQWLLAHLTVGAATVVALVGGWMMRRQRPGEP